jgi:putative ribosome biogenesis GTPase RsgA
MMSKFYCTSGTLENLYGYKSLTGDYVHWQSHESTITQIEDAFDRERKLYQSTIDTLTALLKNPLN